MSDESLRYGLQKAQVSEYYGFLKKKFGDEGLHYIEQYIDELKIQTNDVNTELTQQMIKFYQLILSTIIR